MKLWKDATALVLAVAVTTAHADANDEAAKKKALFERAQKAELPGVWVPAPIVPSSHFAAATAQRLCSAIFIAGMEPTIARATLGDSNALAPVAQRLTLGEPVVDRAHRAVRVKTAEGQTRTARQLGS